MTSVLWTAAIWAFAYSRTRPNDGQDGENRLHFALALSIVATASIVTGSAEEIIQNPVIIERAVRGGLSGLALLIALPVLIGGAPRLLERRLPTFAILCVYGIAVAASTLYSAAPLVTAGKTFEFGVGLVIILGILSLDEPAAGVRTAIRMLIYAKGVEVGVALLGFIALPDLFTSTDSRPGFLTAQTLSSPYGGSNGLSYSSAVFAAFNLALLTRTTDQRSRRNLMLGVAVGVLGVVLSSGRQGLVILVASVLVILLIKSPARLILFLIPLTAGILAFSEVLFQTFARGQSEGLLFSLSGRTFWWTSAVEAWLEQPLSGFGYGAGGRFVALQRVGAGGVSSVHSGYLEILVGVGLIGFLPLMVVVARVIVSAARLLRTEVEMAVLIVPLVLHTAISLGFGGWWSTDLVLLALLAAMSDLWIKPGVLPVSRAGGKVVGPVPLRSR